jgi:hypothetical protein
MAQDLKEYSQELILNPSKQPMVKPIQPKKKVVPRPTVKPMSAQEKQNLVMNIR